MSATPASTRLPQHMIALRRANEIRLAQGRIKAGIAQGQLTLDAVVTYETDADRAALDRMTIFAVLTSARRVGPSRARTLLAALRIPEGKRVGALTDRQRSVLVERLRATIPAACTPA